MLGAEKKIKVNKTLRGKKGFYLLVEKTVTYLGNELIPEIVDRKEGTLSIKWSN